MKSDIKHEIKNHLNLIALASQEVEYFSQQIALALDSPKEIFSLNEMVSAIEENSSRILIKIQELHKALRQLNFCSENNVLINEKLRSFGGDENKKTVLLVDDENYVLESYKGFISKQGFRVFTSNDGIGAIELYKQYNPDYVFLDYRLPDLDGAEVFKRIKDFDSQASIYFISGSNEIKSQVMKLGAQGFIEKPVNMNEFIILLKSLKTN